MKQCVECCWAPLSCVFSSLINIAQVSTSFARQYINGHPSLCAAITEPSTRNQQPLPPSPPGYSACAGNRSRIVWLCYFVVVSRKSSTHHHHHPAPKNLAQSIVSVTKRTWWSAIGWPRIKTIYACSWEATTTTTTTTSLSLSFFKLNTFITKWALTVIITAIARLLCVEEVLEMYGWRVA